MRTHRALSTPKGGIGALILLAAWVALAPAPARAASVYGTVRGPDGIVLAKKSFAVLGAKGDTLRTVTTDDAGRYSVFLRPGIYKLRLGSWRAVLQSLPEPSRQNILFRAGG